MADRPRVDALRGTIAIVLVGIVIGVLVGSGLAVGTASYALAVPGAMETPETTVTHEGHEFEVSAVAERDPGEPLDVEVTVDDDEHFDVDLIDSDEDIVDIEGGTGSGTVTFATDELAPGSYVLGLHADGNYQKIHPVVIAGYDASVSAPETVEPDESFDVTVDIAPTASSGAPDGVEVIVWNTETHVRAAAVHIADETWEATIAASEVDEGDYAVFAVAQGTETFQGEPEMLAVSDERGLSVEAEPIDADDDGGAPPPADDDDEEAEPDPADDEAASETDEPAADDDGADPADEEEADTIDEPPSDDEDPTDESDDADVRDDHEPRTSDDETDDTTVIFPTDDEPTEPADDESIPLAAPLLIVAAILAGAIGYRLLVVAAGRTRKPA